MNRIGNLNQVDAEGDEPETEPTVARRDGPLVGGSLAFQWRCHLVIRMLASQASHAGLNPADATKFVRTLSEGLREQPLPLFTESIMMATEAQKEWHRINFKENKDYYKERDARRRELFKSIIRKEKDKPCRDCGLKFPYCSMDFDHKGDKKFTISQVSSISSEQKLREEIAKCDVVCSNCHRVRTHNMNGEVV